MDIERGNIKIAFQKIPYTYILSHGEQSYETCAYNRIDKNVYLKYAAEVFDNASIDERKKYYEYLYENMKGPWEDTPTYTRLQEGRVEPSVFRMVVSLASRMLCLDGDEIECQFDQLLRWREVSLVLGQDLFTCAFLANEDLKSGIETKKFSWNPIIRSDNDRLHNILEKGMAENHFHLNGSTKVFELNWICLMNHIEGREKEFQKITRTMQHLRSERFDLEGGQEGFNIECKLAALCRVYLFAVVNCNKYLMEQAENILDKICPQNDLARIPKKKMVQMFVPEIQNLILEAADIYGARVNGSVLDYAFEKNMVQYNEDVCRLLAGERKFLYQCYKRALSTSKGIAFDDRQKNVFYAYLLLRTKFRGEMIENNNQIGFANFSDYEKRKEFFIEDHKSYKDELVRLSLNETLSRKNMVSLEARICPKDTSGKLYKALKKNEKIVREDSFGGEMYEKLIYVLHFPKTEELRFVYGTPRNSKLREKAKQQARSIAALMEREKDVNNHIRGIDTCASEIACRPEAFGQVFRYLTDIRIKNRKNTYRKEATMDVQMLHMTYHAGEDFFDIPDGLRAIDEAILFCNMKRGSRIGHALALGIDPEKYYNLKGYRVVLPKQILLDDIVWMYCRAKEFGCVIGEKLKTELIETYHELYKEIYENNVKKDAKCPSIYEYYQSWKLRGDCPEVYKLGEEDFKREQKIIPLKKFDRYRFNGEVNDNIRKNEGYRRLYYDYHYVKEVREEGNKPTSFKIKKEYVELVRAIQDKMIRELACKGIAIETNPSSNYLIGTIKKYEDHPIFRFNSRKLKPTEKGSNLCVSINTDDQGVFDTLLENEYALMTLALKKATDENGLPLYDVEDIYEWIDYVREMGIDQIFS